jgi:hypothetical protein
MQLEEWQRSSWSSGEFIGPLLEWHLREAEFCWRQLLGSDYHRGVPFEWDDEYNDRVQADLFDIAEHLSLPLTNNGDGRTYHYVMAGDFTHLVMQAFERRGWRRPGI